MASQILLISELQTQCTFALIAYSDLIKSLESLESIESRGKEKLDRCWYSIEAFLIAVANISKILWPSSPGGSAIPSEVSSRRENLRNLLSLDDSSPLKARRFRNYLDLYEVRIEEWAATLRDRMLIDSNIVPIDFVSGTDPNRMASMRNFDPQTRTLYFADEKYELEKVVKAVSQLLEKIKANSS
jgi:hypothetical protein